MRGLLIVKVPQGKKVSDTAGTVCKGVSPLVSGTPIDLRNKFGWAALHIAADGQQHSSNPGANQHECQCPDKH